MTWLPNRPDGTDLRRRAAVEVDIPVVTLDKSPILPTAPIGRPAPAGSCDHWIGAEGRYCYSTVSVRRDLTGLRCPLPAPAALSGQPGPSPQTRALEDLVSPCLPTRSPGALR